MTQKVLFLGVYRDGTGWGQAAIDYILSLDAAGVDVVCRPIKLNTHQHEPPQRILELEARSSQGSDVVVQHILPNLMDYNGRMRNIGLYATETSNFCKSAWPERLNNMDEAWVINEQMVDAARDSGVTIPLTVIPHATDITRFQQSYRPLPNVRPNTDPDTFVFYTIGEKVRRKNLAALLKAFHIEFGPNEPVELVIKTSLSGASAEEARREMHGFCCGIKEGLKLWGSLDDYKQEIILTERLTDHDICRLHNTCDCFVQASYGEAWSIPAFDAMAFGKTPIVPDWGGYRGYMTEETGWLVPVYPETVCGIQESFADLYTANEQWAAISVPYLRRALRQAFELENLRKRKATAGIKRAYDFTYERVGDLMKGALDGTATTQQAPAEAF